MHVAKCDHTISPALHSHALRSSLACLLMAALSACSQTALHPQSPDTNGAAHGTHTNQAKTDHPLNQKQTDGIRTSSIQQAQPPQQCLPDSGLAWRQPHYDDLWARIRNGFTLDLDNDNPRIEAEISWFGGHQAYINRVTDRANLYLHYVVDELERHHLPLEIALLPIVESSYDPFAYSHGNASGMWQFISSTGKLYGLKQNWWYDGRRDIKASTAAAIAYLSHLADHYDGDWELALAAYNTGQGNVDRSIRRNKKQGKPTDFWSLKLPRETSAYVPRLLAVAKIVANPKAYDIALKRVQNRPYFQAVNIASQIDMADAADMAEISTEALYQLNPGFNRWATDPRGPFELLVPTEKADIFSQKLAQQAGSHRLRSREYHVVGGDSLSLIARRHNTTVAAIIGLNRLPSTTIHKGQKLLIPLPGTSPMQFAAGSQGPDGGKKRPQRVDYRVRPGDSMWKISRQHGVTVQQLASWNNLSSTSTLKSGSSLALWTEAKQELQTRDANQPVPAPFIRKVGYTVRRGDTLSRIASKFNVNMKDLLSWNPLEQSDHLKPGQRLTLYVDITKAN